MATRLLTVSDVNGVAFSQSVADQKIPPDGLLVSVGLVDTNAQFRARDDLTLSNLFVRVLSNNTDNASRIRARVDGSDGNLVVAFGAGVSGTQEDTINTDVFTAAGAQLFNSVVDPGSGVHGDEIVLSIISYLLEDTDGDVSIVGASGGSAAQTRNQTRFGPIGGFLITTTTEVDTQYRIRVAPTYDELRIFVSANTIDTDSDFDLADDGTPTSLSVTITGDASGEFEDTSNTATPASGSLVGYHLVIANSAMANDDMTPTVWHVAQDSDGRTTMSGLSGDFAGNAAGAVFIAITGDPGNTSATESDAEVSARTAFTAQNVFAFASANTVNGQSDLRLRKTGADSSLIVSWADSTSGEEEDTSNTEDYATTDNVNWDMDTTAGSSGTLTVQTLGFELATTVVAEQPFSEPPMIHRELVVRAY